jgi:flagella basal body P-ring formation protein FlgA
MKLFPAFAFALSLLAAPAFAANPQDLVTEQATAQLGRAMKDTSSFDIRFFGPVPADVVSLSSFDIEPATGRFHAAFVASDGNLLQTSGLAIIQTEVPVPAHQINVGEVIHDKDITTAKLPQAQVLQNTVTRPSDLIGKQARRMLSQGRPILDNSIGGEIAIHRGAAVTIQVLNGGLNVTSPAKSLDDGSIGDRIKVVNTLSRKTIVATIVSNGVVTVQP